MTEFSIPPPSGKISWVPIMLRVPHARKVILKTIKGQHFVHVMINKDGKVVPWDEQDEKWTDGKFEYSEVTHWAEL